MAKKAPDGEKIVATNRKARHDYTLEDHVEAGMVLQGSEVKSLRDGKASIGEAYGVVDNAGEVWLVGAHIPPYEQAHEGGHDPLRRRKLLLHGREIHKLQNRLRDKGVTLIPLSIYFKNGRAKIELALGRGKKHHDKRQDIAKRDAKRDIDRAMRRGG